MVAVVDKTGMLRSRGPMSAVKGVVVHHTGASTAQSAINEFKRGVVLSQYLIDRDGTILQLLPDGMAGNAIREVSYRIPGVGTGLTDKTAISIEVVGRNNADILPAQIAAARGLVQQLSERYGFDPAASVFGHGELQRNKQSDEGMAIVNAIRSNLANAVRASSSMAFDNPQPWTLAAQAANAMAGSRLPFLLASAAPSSASQAVDDLTADPDYKSTFQSQAEGRIPPGPFGADAVLRAAMSGDPVQLQEALDAVGAAIDADPMGQLKALVQLPQYFADAVVQAPGAVLIAQSKLASPTLRAVVPAGLLTELDKAAANLPTSNWARMPIPTQRPSNYPMSFDGLAMAGTGLGGNASGSSRLTSMTGAANAKMGAGSNGSGGFRLIPATGAANLGMGGAAMARPILSPTLANGGARLGIGASASGSPSFVPPQRTGTGVASMGLGATSSGMVKPSPMVATGTGSAQLGFGQPAVGALKMQPLPIMTKPLSPAGAAQMGFTPPYSAEDIIGSSQGSQQPIDFMLGGYVPGNAAWPAPQSVPTVQPKPQPLAPLAAPITIASLPATPQIGQPMDIRPPLAMGGPQQRQGFLGRLLGGLAGGALAGPVGGLLGGFLGGHAGGGIGNLFAGRGTIPNVTTQLSNLQSGGATNYGGYTPMRFSPAAAPMSPSGGSQYAYTTGSGPQGQRATSYTTNSGKTITFYTDPNSGRTVYL